MQHDSACGSLANVLERLNLFGYYRHRAAVVYFEAATHQHSAVVLQNTVCPAEHVRPCNDLYRAELIFELEQTEAIALLRRAQVQVQHDPAERHHGAVVE